jgi:hypothetical protein
VKLPGSDSHSFTLSSTVASRIAGKVCPSSLSRSPQRPFAYTGTKCDRANDSASARPVLLAIGHILSQSKRYAFRLLRNWRYLLILNQVLRNNPSDQEPLNDLFCNVSDDFWFWAHTDGCRRTSGLARLLPNMPDERLQLQFTGMSGDGTLQQGFSAYKLFKYIANKYGRGIRRDDMILDFGCGWGRIGIGEGLAAFALPHHRAYGSVHGGSCSLS